MVKEENNNDSSHTPNNHHLWGNVIIWEGWWQHKM
jgi:hypothetical protein